MSNRYRAHGYNDREDYLSCLAEDHGVSLASVEALADVLGPEEDFDGLVVALAYWGMNDDEEDDDAAL